MRPGAGAHVGDCGEKLALSARGLYDLALSLRLAGRAVGNDVEAGGKRLIMITGANQGGKSTFLRSVGLAQLMMQCGLFVWPTSRSRPPTSRKVRRSAARSSGPCSNPGVRILFVSHLYELAHGLFTTQGANEGNSALFLRPERRDDGQRTFRLLPGEPLSTSHGPDLYRRIFGADRGLTSPAVTVVRKGPV